MNIKQIEDTISSLNKLNIQALIGLSDVDIDSPCYKLIASTRKMLDEQQNLLWQLKQELRTLKEEKVVTSAKAEVIPRSDTDRVAATVDDSATGTAMERRGRGGLKQYYLLDNSGRQQYVARIRRLFDQHYTNRSFVLPDGSTIKAPRFLAYIYELGIKQGLALPGAPVKDFADLVKEAAATVTGFTTAYNTIQNVTREWRMFCGQSYMFERTAHLFSIDPTKVKPQYSVEYQGCIATMNQVEAMFG